MNFRIKFSVEAEETYDAVVAQLRQRWGDEFIDKFENKLLKSLNLIMTEPSVYPVIDVITETRRCVLHKNCSMLYKIYDEEILIVCFWDNRQEPLI